MNLNPLTNCFLQSTDEVVDEFYRGEDVPAYATRLQNPLGEHLFVLIVALLSARHTIMGLLEHSIR